MDLKKLNRREFFEKSGRAVAIGAIAAICVKLSFNKSNDRAANNYPCLEKACRECALFKDCGLPEAVSERGIRD
ncbi:MAG: hypothetical protein N2487_00725 [Verrucomicrobiae bacterium]|nr:hypothetical protein [Verrucomicrobiae bacterium]